MNIKEFLNKVCKEIKYTPAKSGIAEELNAHIQEIKENYINKGIQEQDLPFVTYGGVNFIVNSLTIAVIFSVYRRKDINEYDDFHYPFAKFCKKS